MARKKKFLRRNRIVGLGQSDYRIPRYMTWRKAVYKRDGYKCRWPGCKCNSKKINAHHIKKWATHPLMRFIVSNGITLCWEHHESVRGKEDLYERFFHEILCQDLIKKIEELEKERDDKNDSI